MERHKILIQQEGLTFDTLPERAKRKIEKYNALQTSNKVGIRLKTGELTEKTKMELIDLDEDICDLIYTHIADIEEQKQEETERLRLEEIENNKQTPEPPIVQTQPEVRKRSGIGLW